MIVAFCFRNNLYRFIVVVDCLDLTGVVLIDGSRSMSKKTFVICSTPMRRPTFLILKSGASLYTYCLLFRILYFNGSTFLIFFQDWKVMEMRLSRLRPSRKSRHPRSSNSQLLLITLFSVIFSPLARYRLRFRPNVCTFFVYVIVDCYKHFRFRYA